MIIEMIEDFAAGKDGVLGNADDVLSPDGVDLLKKMVTDGTIERLVGRMYKSNFIQRILNFLFPGCYK